MLSVGFEMFKGLLSGKWTWGPWESWGSFQVHFKETTWNDGFLWRSNWHLTRGYLNNHGDFDIGLGFHQDVGQQCVFQWQDPRETSTGNGSDVFFSYPDCTSFFLQIVQWWMSGITRKVQRLQNPMNTCRYLTLMIQTCIFLSAESVV